MECDMADVKFETVEDIDKKIAELQNTREAVLKMRTKTQQHKWRDWLQHVALVKAI